MRFMVTAAGEALGRATLLVLHLQAAKWGGIWLDDMRAFLKPDAQVSTFRVTRLTETLQKNLAQFHALIFGQEDLSSGSDAEGGAGKSGAKAGGGAAGAHGGKAGAFYRRFRCHSRASRPYFVTMHPR